MAVVGLARRFIFSTTWLAFLFALVVRGAVGVTEKFSVSQLVIFVELLATEVAATLGRQPGVFASRGAQCLLQPSLGLLIGHVDFVSHWIKGLLKGLLSRRLYSGSFYILLCLNSCAKMSQTMSKSKTTYTCGSCGGQSTKWTGRCSHCSEWNTLTETRAESGHRFDSWTGKAEAAVVALPSVKGQDYARLSTGLGELDRCLGGGLVSGSMVLLGGDPGVGKSTLLLQTLADMGKRAQVLYVTGEESNSQVALRAQRMGLGDAPVNLLAETELERILAKLEQEKPQVVVVDSIQTIYSNQLASAPGTVAQVRDCAAHLTRFAKSYGVSIILVGHVTKEGTLAGPRVLEHMVDTVLYFEGEAGSAFRMVRAFKNRFGAANELGVFSMDENGLQEVTNPSSMFLTLHEKPVSGSCVLAAIEGNRPFLVEIQVLVEDAPTPNAKRSSTGLDTNRLQMLLAVLHKHAGIAAFDQNVYVKVVGGVRLQEPAADLGLLMAAHSSLTGRPLPEGLVVFGEVGLAGELRAVPDTIARLKEAAKLGFTQALVPARGLPATLPPGIRVTSVSRIEQALACVRDLRLAA